MKAKEKDDELIQNIDRAINELVYEKTQLIKAYNYYHGKRDPEQFRHLEENYGIGTPTSVEFVPLVKKHIDVLVGEYLSLPMLPKVSCKDKSTLSNISRDKKMASNGEITNILKKHLKNKLASNDMSSNFIPEKPLSNPEVLNDLRTAEELIEKNFISEYEIASQNIVDWAVQSRNIDFINKRRLLLTDLLVSGTCYYRVKESPSNENVVFEPLNPIHSFIDRNPESPYLNKSHRSVIRNYWTKDQILAKYGDVLTKEDLKTLDSFQDFGLDYGTIYLRTYENTVSGDPSSDGILGGFEVTPLMPFEKTSSKEYRVYPVYEVEFLKTEKEDGKFITNRYAGVRISSNVYVLTGKVENVSRSIDDPRSCTLSVNGIFYADRNGDPFSLILSTASLQDKFDMLNFYRDNIISESGTVGDWIDIAYLPKVLGSDLTERLLKWKAYKKQGTALIDSSQEGTPPMNTTFQGFDDSIKLTTIQAIDLAIQRVEETCSGITGVFKERLGGVEERDAVTNVALGVKQSTFITKQHFYAMDLITREVLLDILNLAKIVYKKGISGTLILGNKLTKIFTALPKHFTVSDHDIHIADSAEIMKEKGIMEQVSFEFIKSGTVEPDIILEILTASGLTSMKADIAEALAKKKKENNQLGKLQQQVEELNRNLTSTTEEAKKLQEQVQFLNGEKVKLEQDRLQFQKELEWFKAQTQKEFNSSKLELDKKRVDLEALQLIDESKLNNEIKDK